MVGDLPERCYYALDPLFRSAQTAVTGYRYAVAIMDNNTLLIIIVVVLLLGGGGFFFRGRR